MSAYEKLSWEYIDSLCLTAEDFKEFSSKLKTYKGVGSLEEGLYPDMEEAFYSCIDYYSCVPNIDLFVDYYAEHLGVTDTTSKQFYEVQVELHNAYTQQYSLLHFYHMAKENKHIEKVLFVYKYYKENNIKLFTKFKGSWFGIKEQDEEVEVPESMKHTKLFYKKPTKMQVEQVRTVGSKMNLYTQGFVKSLVLYLNTLK